MRSHEDAIAATTAPTSSRDSKSEKKPLSWTCDGHEDAARRTFATIIPIIKTRDVTASWPMPKAAAKTEMPKAKAMAEMIWMKWWISLLMGVCSASCVERHHHETALAAPSTASR